MLASTPRTSSAKHSPIARSVDNHVGSCQNIAPELSPKTFLLQDIELKPENYPRVAENIDNLLTADLVKTPASFDSTSSESEEEIAMLPVKDAKLSRLSAALPNRYYLGCGSINVAESNQRYRIQYPLTSHPDSMIQFEAESKPTIKAGSMPAKKRLEKRRRDEEVKAIVPIQEKAVFAVNPLSPPAQVAAAFATTHTSGFTGLGLLSNVSSCSSQWGSLPAATVSEAANTNTFTYPAMGSFPVKETKSKVEGCRCQQSKCLKLYCACFRDGKICVDSCKCVSCANTEAERGGRVLIARQEVLTKKPNAFGDKSCRCKKSRCLKMYCACFSSGNPCGDSCKCEDCSNPTGVRSLPIRPDAEEVRIKVKT
mmetsp:Transcript_6131/g.9563  ORF Transcript_6131/g.9563 Transcript_6131/m.9563 type:complete len:369 (+) Transcript_6131:72-1178(+)